MGLRIIRNEARFPASWIMAFISVVMGVDRGCSRRRQTANQGLSLRYVTTRFSCSPNVAQGMYAAVARYGTGLPFGTARVPRGRFGNTTPDNKLIQDVVNAVWPAIVSGIKWSFGLMARYPTDSGWALTSTGDGVSRHGRRLLLAVIEAGEISHPLFLAWCPVVSCLFLKNSKPRPYATRVSLNPNPEQGHELILSYVFTSHREPALVDFYLSTTRCPVHITTIRSPHSVNHH